MAWVTATLMVSGRWGAELETRRFLPLNQVLQLTANGKRRMESRN
jgi:hypothetical protein